MRARPALAALAGAVALVTLAGCGSSTGAVKLTGATPAGATRFQGTGFSVAVPPGWAMTTAGSPGHALSGWFPKLRSTSAHLFVETLSGNFRVTPKAAFSQLRSDNATNAANLKASSITMTKATLPGGSAVVITSRGSSKYGPHLVKTMLVTTASGTDYLVTIGSYGTGSTFNPVPYVESFKLLG